jgi:seryl-tRNA synthetase
MVIRFDEKRGGRENEQFFVDMLSYVSPKIQNVKREGKDILLEINEEDQEIVENKVEALYQMIESGSISGKEVPVKTLEDHTDEETVNKENVYETLCENGDVVELSPGVYSYSNLFLKVFRYFNNKIDAYGKDVFKGIREYKFPVLHPIKRYEKGGYFENFPHYIMFGTSMKNDLDVLERFSKNGLTDETILDEMQTPSQVLRHAACVPVYEMLEGRTIQKEHPEKFLVSGTCFRNEGKNTFELSRLNEFFMKEYVFVGSPDQCKELIGQAKGLWNEWQSIFRANTRLDTANDSFFASNYKKLQFFQVIGDSKREFKWQIPGHGTYISCGSINFHRTHFSKPYTIKNENGDLCYTACFAFGIERLTYALLSQKGLDPSKWDAATYEEISKYVDL